MLGVIGGTGLYNVPDLDNVTTIDVKTPFGIPSSPVTRGTINERDVVFIARHGIGHRLNPSEIPFRANIHALKQLGVTHLLSVNAVGSLQGHLPPRAAVVPDQIIDRTSGFRERTFFENGIVAHVGLADPFCAAFRKAIIRHARSGAREVHDGGTYLCIEGPQFSTRAESNLYRQWGADIIGMTAMPEARLAREAGLCYGTLALVTDYDVWHMDEDDVTLEMVHRVLADNTDTAQRVIRNLVADELPPCDTNCAHAIDTAIITHDGDTPSEARERLALLLPSQPD